MSQTIIATFGELMMRLDCPPAERFQRNWHFNKFFGGAEGNVAVVLSQLGIEARYITALPENDLGQSAIDALRSFGVNTSFINRNRNRIGIYFTEHGNNIRPSRVIYDRKHSAFASLKPGTINWNEALENADCFFWSGISAALTANATDVCKEALKVAKQKNMLIAADMNYRSTLWEYGKQPSEVMPELLSHCNVITGDLTSIEVYFGIKTPVDLSHEEQFRFVAAELTKWLPSMNTLAMSFRGTDEFQQSTYYGAIMSGKDYFFSNVYVMPEVIDRIGSGDALQGGLLYGITQKMPPQEVINFAIACGAIKHSMEGDFTILSKHEVEQFIKTGPVNRVIR